MIRRAHHKLFCTASTFIFICLCVFTSCNQKSSAGKAREYDFRLPTKKTFRIYSIDIDQIMKMRFSEIEKRIGGQIRIDEEVAVIFLDKETDFVSKHRETKRKDRISLVFGPVEDVSMYKRHKEVQPNTLTFYGTVKVDDDVTTKSTITRELAANLFLDNSSKDILERIRAEVIEGDPRSGAGVTIKFDIPGFPTAVLYLGFRNDNEDGNIIVYKYIFSRMKEPYP